ncbi:hypothetical protein [Paenibacillus sp. ACRRY]|uniref:XkdQ/YqbQ family protein n=1 Tax=Paenibacillus sp. ACRRY TaxID=2918208 RepID=UPI001EF4C9B1|nr:hypothetical protein [Paenibacillus sp. ACRRY]MCG7386871.1 hypothetical protein [Paenibacillus sp. ACRRY]
MSTQIRVLYDGKYYVEPLVTTATWSGDVAQPHRTLTLSLSNTLNGEDQEVAFELGKELRLYVDGKGVFRGVIFTYDITDKGDAVVIAYDENVYLTKNVDTRKFVKMTAGGIIAELCKSFGIPTGSIASTGYVIPRMILRNRSLWDMMVTALTETRKQNGRKFVVYASNGKLGLREKKDAAVRWMIEDGVNIVSANRTRSIEELRTAVKVVGGESEEKQIVATEKNTELAKRYGLMQHYESADSKLNASQLRQLAKTRLKELSTVREDVSVSALGITEVVAGTAVYAFESMTDLVGGFYVNADSHTFSNGTHMMDLTLSKTDDLPKLEYEDDEEAKESAKESKKKAKEKAKKGA